MSERGNLLAFEHVTVGDVVGALLLKLDTAKRSNSLVGQSEVNLRAVRGHQPLRVVD